VVWGGEQVVILVYSHLVYRDDALFESGWLTRNCLLHDNGSCHFGV
jgi:hypothetical protein